LAWSIADASDAGSPVVPAHPAANVAADAGPAGKRANPSTSTPNNHLMPNPRAFTGQITRHFRETAFPCRPPSCGVSTSS